MSAMWQEYNGQKIAVDWTELAVLSPHCMLNKKHVGTRATSVQTLVSPMLHQQTSCTAHNPWPIA